MSNKSSHLSQPQILREAARIMAERKPETAELQDALEKESLEIEEQEQAAGDPIFYIWKVLRDYNQCMILAWACPENLPDPTGRDKEAFYIWTQAQKALAAYAAAGFEELDRKKTVYNKVRARTALKDSAS